MRLHDAHSNAIEAAARHFRTPPVVNTNEPTNDAPDENLDPAAEVSTTLNDLRSWRSTEKSVFVGNLSWDTTSADLFNFFAEALPVVSCEGA